MFFNSLDFAVFLPPYAKEVLDKMIESNNYKYLNSIHDKLADSFIKHKHEFWDLSDSTKFNSNDTEFIDGFHGGEVT